MKSRGLVFRIQNESAEGVDPITAQVGNLTPKAVGEQGAAISQEDAAPEQESEKSSDSGIKEVILKGPIGYAYTDILNQLLGKKNNRSGVIRSESFRMENTTQLLVTNITEEEQQEETPSEKNRAFIFVNDGRKMSIGDVEQLLTAVEENRKSAGNDAFIGVLMDGAQETISEGGPRGNHMSQAIIHMESHLKVKVLYTCERARRSIINYLGA